MGVWDNLNTHVSAAMAELVAARPWLTVFQLPPYAHELNLVKPVWSHLKRPLANLTRHTIAELTALVKTPPPSGCSTAPSCLPATSPAPGSTSAHVTPALNDLQSPLTPTPPPVSSSSTATATSTADTGTAADGLAGRSSVPLVESE